MDLVVQDNPATPIRHTFIRSGVPGNYEVVYAMIRLIRDSVEYDTGLERFTKQWLASKGLSSQDDPKKILEAVYSFVTANVKYIEDEAGLVESIKSARVTLSDGYGDCDDLTILIVTLLGYLGFEDIAIALARYDENNPTFQHVYAVVYVGDDRYAFDASLPNAQLTDEVEPFEIREIPVFDYSVPGLDGVSGIVNNLKYSLSKVGKIALETVPHVAGYLPLGFVSSQAMTTGAHLLNASTKAELSLPNTATRINQELDRIIISLLRSEIAHDMALALALQLASQLSAVEKRTNSRSYQVIKESIQTKLNFIKDFAGYAKENDINLVHLNAHAMIALGVAGAGFGAYTLYKRFKRGR